MSNATNDSNQTSSSLYATAFVVPGLEHVMMPKSPPKTRTRTRTRSQPPLNGNSQEATASQVTLVSDEDAATTLGRKTSTDTQEEPGKAASRGGALKGFLRAIVPK
ncbi:hypothetical protein ACRALDRAFT_1075077 [Sodiomyces alcalophilus JCM 7366]|uniref:uncharacterized protein n=1 Tax=Sodiomyces alcalophilus JCM 7366 TaxID=591952 RepID=UPI0039B5BCC7